MDQREAPWRITNPQSCVAFHTELENYYNFFFFLGEITGVNKKCCFPIGWQCPRISYTIEWKKNNKINWQPHCVTGRGTEPLTAEADCHKAGFPHHVSGGWLCTTWMILPGGYRGVEADRAMLRSLGWSHRQALGGAAGWVWAPLSSSGSSDLGMHLVPPAMILHCGTEGEEFFSVVTL